MASHHISLAKASFAASLFRPDATKVSRDDLATFHSALEAALAKCSPRNIQTCKQWLISNVVVSTARTSAFGKYLASLSKHLASLNGNVDTISLARRRLHILYVLHDVLHHTKYHATGNPVNPAVLPSLQPFVYELFQLAASDRKTRVVKRLHELADFWRAEQFYEDAFVSRLHDVLSGGSTDNIPPGEEEVLSEKVVRELPYVMPATHGDPSLAFYDLPAANLMPLIVPNSSQSIRPEDVKALQFTTGVADESLVAALKTFLADIERQDGLTKLDPDQELPDMDEMGQFLYHDEGGHKSGESYYGWSRSFCEKMKDRGRDKTGDSPRRSRSVSSTRSRDGRQRKRRRYSDSMSDYSRSSDASVRSRGRSRDSLDARASRRRKSNDRSRSRSNSPISPIPPSHGFQPFQNPPHGQSSASFPLPPAFGLPFPPPPTVPPLPGFPIPPPPPPHNWQGQWPPVHPLPFPPPAPPPPNVSLPFGTSYPQQRYDGLSDRQDRRT